MRAIAICGSPRTGGNTEILLRRCLVGLEKHGIQTELIPLRDKTIHGCKACGYCRDAKDGTCAIKDDMQPVFEKMKEADIIVVGSPVYFGSATPEMMALLDRVGYMFRGGGENPLSRKIGGPIVVARRAGHNFTYAQLMYWFMINDMVVPGSSYWNVALARGAGEVENDGEGLRTVDRFAENLAWLAQKLVEEPK